MKKINFDLKYEFKKIVKKSHNKIAIDYGDEKKYDFNFLDLKKLMEESFYDTKSQDFKYYKIHKLIFEDLPLNKFGTKPKVNLIL